MIRKFGQVETEKAQVRRIFEDVSQWPSWMPGVRSVRVLRHGQDAASIALSQRLDGHTIEAELDCRFGTDTIRIHQRRGDLRKWDAVWQLREPPEGTGTTLGLALEIEVGGIMGWLASQQRLDRLAERVFRDTLAGIDTHARTLAEEQPEVETEAAGELLLRVYQTPEGLEMWIGGRLLKLPPCS